jgi:hypothetical protein
LLPLPTSPTAIGAAGGCATQGAGQGSTGGVTALAAAVLSTPVVPVPALGAGASSPVAGSVGGPADDPGARPD